MSSIFFMVQQRQEEKMIPMISEKCIFDMLGQMSKVRWLPMKMIMMEAMPR